MNNTNASAFVDSLGAALAREHMEDLRRAADRARLAALAPRRQSDHVRRWQALWRLHPTGWSAAAGRPTVAHR